MKLIRLILTFFLVAVALPAQAHDQLIDQTPKPGEVIEAGIVEIRLSFNNELLNLAGSGAEILVLNQEGWPQTPGCAVIENRDAINQVSLATPGEYSVAWRVVSADGHPISGEFKFTLANSTGYEADPNFSFIDCPEPSVISPPAQEPTGSWYWILWVSLAAVAVGLFFFLRPKKQ